LLAGAVLPIFQQTRKIQFIPFPAYCLVATKVQRRASFAIRRQNGLSKSAKVCLSWQRDLIGMVRSSWTLAPQRRDQERSMNIIGTSANEMGGIVGTCINCGTSASLTATFVVIAIGVLLAIRFEHRKSASAKAGLR
jgi:hypothetical protein